MQHLPLTKHQLELISRCLNLRFSELCHVEAKHSLTISESAEMERVQITREQIERAMQSETEGK